MKYLVGAVVGIVVAGLATWLLIVKSFMGKDGSW